MRPYPASPRLRRRLAWLGAVVAAAGAVVLLIYLFPSPERVESEPLRPGGWVPAPQREVEPSQDATTHALAVAADFVRTAVARRNVGSSWDLVTPTFRTGFTRKAWAKGDIPVVPFPVDATKWRLEYSWEDELGFEVALLPPPKSDVRATIFDVGMRAVGSGDDRHWLVDYFSPGPVGMAPAAAAPVRPGNLPNLGSRTSTGDSRLNTKWLILPFGVLALALIVPLGFGTFQWYRGYKARRAYASGQGR